MLFVERGLDGFCVVSSELDPRAAIDRAGSTPLVIVQPDHPSVLDTPGRLPPGTIRTDDASGIEQALHHLIECGYRDIAYLGAGSRATNTLRGRTAARVLREESRPADPASRGARRCLGRADGTRGRTRPEDPRGGRLLRRQARAGVAGRPAIACTGRARGRRRRRLRRDPVRGDCRTRVSRPLLRRPRRWADSPPKHCWGRSARAGCRTRSSCRSSWSCARAASRGRPGTSQPCPRRAVGTSSRPAEAERRCRT